MFLCIVSILSCILEKTLVMFLGVKCHIYFLSILLLTNRTIQILATQDKHIRAKCRPVDIIVFFL